MQVLRPVLTDPAGFGEVAEESLEAGWGEHREDPAGTRDHPLLGVRQPARPEDLVPRPGRELGAVHGEDVLALEDEEVLVVLVVDVHRYVDRIDLLDDREGPTGRLRRRPDRELHPPVSEPFATRGVDQMRHPRPIDARAGARARQVLCRTHGRASSTKLNMLSATRFTCSYPAAVRASAIRRSPAWAPSAQPAGTGSSSCNETRGRVRLGEQHQRGPVATADVGDPGAGAQPLVHASSLWDVRDDPWRKLLLAGGLAGWELVLFSTFLIDHLDLFGLRQALAAFRGQPPPQATFAMPLLYRVVRHPLHLGFLVAFWCTPTMTVGQLIFAVATRPWWSAMLRTSMTSWVSFMGVAVEHGEPGQRSPTSWLSAARLEHRLHTLVRRRIL